MKARASIFMLFLSLQSAFPQSQAIREFVNKRGLGARLNPGSFSLVGDVYPDKKKIGLARTGKISECFPGITLDPPEDLEEEVKTVVFENQSLDFLFKFAPKIDPALGADSGETPDANSVKSMLTGAGVKSVRLHASGLKKLALSTAPLTEAMKKGACFDQITQQGHSIVTDAIGATSMNYTLLDSSGRELNVTLGAKIIDSLFRLGLSKSRTEISSITFSKPAYFGFAIVQWKKDKDTFELVNAR